MRPVLVLIILVLVLLPAPVAAHGLRVTAYVEGGKVFAEGRTADGAMCKACRVEVVEKETRRRLLEGRTDDQGRYSFSMPEADAITVVMYSGPGHRGSCSLSEEDLRESFHGEADTDSDTEEEHNHHDTATSGPDEEIIEAAVERVLDRRLEPLRRDIAGLREAVERRPGITEVLGGIGYIIGLAGLASYFRYRKMDKSKNQ